MFDKYHTENPSTTYVPYEKTIIEQKAPTGESIKLYAELREKAYQSVIDTIEINDNSFNLKALICNDFPDCRPVCRYEFTLNGRKVNGAIKINRLCNSKQKMVEQIFTEASRQIAVELVQIIAKQELSERRQK